MSGALPMFADWNEALDGVVHALGGFKKVGVLLRPELSEKPIAADYHAAKHWMDAELGYEQGRPLKPEDEAASLTQRGADLVRELRTITERLERITQPALAAVSKAA